MNNNEYFKEIENFIIDFWYEVDIHENTRIEADLGIYGDDAVDFLLAFSKKFNVDVSQFMADEYFSPEGIDIFGSFKDLFKKGEKAAKKELLVKDLIKAIEIGKLI